MVKGCIHTGYCPLPLSYSAYAISRVLYLAEARPLSFIYDDNHLPPPATYPPTSNEQPLIVGVHGLATHETYCRGVLLPSRWALTPPSHPYPCGRSFSSTLLRPHGRQVVSLRGALCCSDFPPPPCGGSDRARMRRKDTKIILTQCFLLAIFCLRGDSPSDGASQHTTAPQARRSAAHSCNDSS